MRKTKKTLAILAIVAMVFTMIPMQVFADTAYPTRISGTTQYDTAAAIAEQGWAAGSTSAVLAAGMTGNTLVDALAAGPLAATLNIPILLTEGNTLTPAAAAELTKLKVTKVYVTSGTSVIKQPVLDALKTADITVVALGGFDAAETSVNIAKEIAKTAPVTSVVLAGGDGQDALSVASIAGAKKMPILYTDNAAALPTSVKNYLATLTLTSSYVIGGTAVVSDAQKAQLSATATRYAGNSAYDTNLAVITGFNADINYANVFVANGGTLVDALAGAPLAAAKKAAIVLTDGTATTAASYVNGKLASTSVVTALGGTSVVPATVLSGVVYTAPAVLSVSSVSAINAKQIEVAFNQAVDKTTAKDVTNYSIKVAGLAAVPMTVGGATGATAKLSDDGSKVTITLTNTLKTATWNTMVNGDVFQVIVKNVKDVATTQTIADTTTNVIFSDKVAPTFVSASSSAKTITNTITLVFNEPMDVTAATVTINGVGAIVAAGSTSEKATVTSTSNLVAGTSYTLSLLNFKDAAGNLTATNPISTTVTVVGDTTTPTVSSVNVIRNSSIEVTFSKDMDAATINAGTLRLLDNNLTASGIGVTSVLPKVVDSANSKTIFVITVNALPYNVSNNFSGVIAYSSDIKDLSGNALAAGTGAVSTAKETVAPAFGNSSFKKVTSYNNIATANGAIVVKYTKPVQLGAAIAANYTVIDDAGSTSANNISAMAINPNDKTELVLTLGAAIASTAKTYTVVIPGTAVKELSIEALAAASANTTVDVSTGAPTASDVSKPTVVWSATTAATSTTSGTTFDLTIVDVGTAGLDFTTVTNPANYILDGAALPSGSYLTYASGTNTATVNIPAGTIASDKTYVLNVNGIKDKAGNLANPFIDSTNIVLKSDIKPVLSTAVINANGSLSLGFSKDVIVKAALTSADFLITANGIAVPTANAVFTDGTGSDDKKYVVTLAALVEAGADANAATTADNRVFIDCNADGVYVAGTDILVTTGTTSAIGAKTADANLLSTLTVKANTAVTVTDRKTLANPLKIGTIITVK